MPDAPAPATTSYKWPSKVLRYKITCPFQRMLVVKHEAQIDWDGQRHGTRIESTQALDAHIRDVMLPALHRWMDPGDEKSHYCRQIDLEKMLANPAPHIQEARDLGRREGGEASRRFLLDHINRQKKEQFESWWDYVMKGNPAYRKHPAFQYLILRPVLESSNAKTTRSPLPVNAEALALVCDRIKAGRVDPRRTKLVQLLARFMAFGNLADEEKPQFGTDCRWVVIKRSDYNAAERVAALSQGSGWCVASSSMADSYLRSSDFHLLVEDGRARVALRLTGGQAVEVEGKNNGDPGPWWPRILLYLAARGTSIGHRWEQEAPERRRIRKELADAALQGTQRLREILKEQPAKVHLLDSIVAQEDEAAQLVVREAWIACVRADPVCGGLLPDWMEVDAEVKRAIEEGWVSLLVDDPMTFHRMPADMVKLPAIVEALRIGWIGRLQKFPSGWRRCPRFLKADEAVVQAFRIGWIERLEKSPDEWKQCPKFLQADTRFVQACKTAWIGRLENFPSDWKQFPEFLKADAGFVQACKTAWIWRLEKSPSDWTQCPEYLQADSAVVQACRTGWVGQLMNHPLSWQDCPEFLQQELQHDTQIVQKLTTGWGRSIEYTPDEWSKCPGFLQADVAIVQARRTGWIRKLGMHPSTWHECPDFLQADVAIVQARKKGWIRRLETQPSIWHECPDFLQADPAVALARRAGWIRELELYPHTWHRCPDFLQLDAELVQARKTGLIRGVAKDPTTWSLIPERLQPDLQKDATVLQMLRSGWIELLEKNPDTWSECPGFLRAHTEIVQARKAGWIAWLEEQYPATRATWIERLLKEGVLVLADLKPQWRKGIHTDVIRVEAPTFEISPTPLPPYAAASLVALAAEPRVTLPIVQAWRHNPRMELANCHKALGALRRSPQNYDTLPPEQKEHALIRQAAALGWADWVQKTPEASSKVPAEFQDHPEVAEQVRRAFAKCLEMKLKQVEENPSITDEQLEHLAIPTANRKMRKTIREIRLKYWKAQVKKGWRNWSTMPPSLQQEEVVLKVMREGLGPEIRRAPNLWKDLPEGYRQDECLQRVHRFATRA